MFLQIGCKITKNFRQHHNPSPTILASTDPEALGEGFPTAKHIAISDGFRSAAPYVGVAFLVVALYFVYRSFYKMRIK